jgi:hypothetical protein
MHCCLSDKLYHVTKEKVLLADFQLIIMLHSDVNY